VRNQRSEGCTGFDGLGYSAVEQPACHLAQDAGS